MVVQVAALAGIPPSILVAADHAGARMEASLAGKFAAASSSEELRLARSLLRHGSAPALAVSGSLGESEASDGSDHRSWAQVVQCWRATRAAV